MLVRDRGNDRGVQKREERGCDYATGGERGETWAGCGRRGRVLVGRECAGTGEVGDFRGVGGRGDCVEGRVGFRRRRTEDSALRGVEEHYDVRNGPGGRGSLEHVGGQEGPGVHYLVEEAVRQGGNTQAQARMTNLYMLIRY